MIEFHFAARDDRGRLVSGTLASPDRSGVLVELRRRRLTPIEVRPATRLFAKKRRARPRARREELTVFTRQLATMIGAGLPLLEALEILETQAETASFRSAVSTLVQEVRGGKDVSQALEACPRVFSKLFVSMVRAGEVSGQLDVILIRLAEYLESTAALRREVRSAITYPVASLVLIVAISSFLMLGVVPQFEPVFEALGVKLPGLTKFVMGSAQWFKANVLGVAAALFGLFVAATLFRRTSRGGYIVDALLLRLPIVGPLFRKVALSRFSRTFATLVHAGVPILGAMEIVGEVSGNRVIARAVQRAKESVRAGDPIAAPLAASSVFPPMVTRMIAVGERSGALETLLEKIAVFYDQQVNAAVKSLTSILEPILIGFMGLFVGTIVLAVFLPIFELQKTLAGGR